MFMFVTYPWPVPSANVEPPGQRSGVAAAHRAGALEQPSTFRASQVEDLVCWTFQERLRIRWYRLRMTISQVCLAARRPASRG